MTGEIRYEIRSAYFHVMLSRAVKAGFALTDIEKTGNNVYRFSVDARRKKAFEDFLCEFHPQIRETGLRGGMRIRAFHWKHPALLVCCALAIALIYMLSLRVWVINAADADVKSALYELGVRPGIKKSEINGNYLSGALTTLLEELVHVDIRISGVYLYADAYRKDPVPEILSAGSAGDLVAKADGIIVSVNVLSGSANVKAGDTVRKGEILIRGEERAGKNGEKTFVRAEGSVTARIWTQAESVCALSEEKRRFTGRKECEVYLKTPFFTRKLAGENSFGLFETVTESAQVIGLFCPVTVETHTRLEYEKTFAPIDTRQAYAALEARAVAGARRLAPAGAVENAVLTEINETDGYIRCGAVIEWILEIAHDKQGG